MLTLLLSNVIAYNCYCVCSQRSDMCPISSSSALQFLSRKHQRLNNSNVNRGLQIQNTEITATVDQYERTTLQLLSPARPSHSITAAPLSKNVHRRKNNESSRAQSAIRSPQHFHSYENSRASISLCLYAAKMWLSCFFLCFIMSGFCVSSFFFHYVHFFLNFHNYFLQKDSDLSEKLMLWVKLKSDWQLKRSVRFQFQRFCSALEWKNRSLEAE